MIVWDVQGAPEPIHDIQFTLSTNQDGTKLYYILGVGLGEDGAHGYVSMTYKDQTRKEGFSYVRNIKTDWKPPSTVEYVLLEYSGR